MPCLPISKIDQSVARTLNRSRQVHLTSPFNRVVPQSLTTTDRSLYVHQLFGTLNFILQLSIFIHIWNQFLIVVFSTLSASRSCQQHFALKPYAVYMATSQAGHSSSPPLLKDSNVLCIMPSLLCLTFRLIQSYPIEVLLFYSS
ncbi:hypothetical protein LXL04_008106 [Taraxacum kok-saghyz]